MLAETASEIIAPTEPGVEQEIAISVRNVGKMYRIYDRPQDRLKQMLFWRFGRHYGREFWALRDVSLEVRRGETIGIIGRNGSGKSTLLQIIAGTLAPSQGDVQVNGRVAALLELGSGFNPEFTGRENVYLNGAILGLGRQEMEARFDEITAFADIGDFIDQPVKFYSSGMVVRLAFAVTSCIEPDILIVDEALAVGDISFQARCLDKIKALTAAGTTTLFVTHDIGTFQNLCDYGYLLDHGHLFSHGRPAHVAMQYYELMRESEHARRRLVAAPDQAAQVRADLRHTEAVIIGKLGEGEYRFGSNTARIVDYRVTNEIGRETSAIRVGETFAIAVRVEFDDRVDNLAVGIMLRNAQGQNLMGMHSFHENRINFGPHDTGDEIEVTCEQEMLLNPGEYLLSIGLADCRSDYDFTSLDNRSNLTKISVFGKPLGYGLVHTHPRFSLSQAPRSNTALLHDDLEYVKATYRQILDTADVAPIVEEIMRHGRESTVTTSDIEQEERAWPGAQRFVETGYHQMMLGRYAFAGSQFCRSANVLDTGCGLGWGSYLVAHFARHVTAFDIDAKIVEFCAATWKADNIRWLTGDARNLSFLGETSYDVALGMETVEHFSQEDGATYVRAVAEVLRPGGVFIGTSAFPETPTEAKAMQHNNPHHPHILTRTEMLELLNSHFERATIIGNWMFIAVK